jgi:sodium-dependent phosphate cotransporter
LFQVSRESWKVLGQILLLAVILYAFLVSIQLLGSSFKLFGRDLAQQLIEMTSNPLVGLVAGILATTLAQSSSTTTSITVGLVAGGALTIEGAIPVIMGANIGTSVTNTLVSMGHITRKEEFRRALAGATVHDFFNVMVVLILLPVEIYFHFIEGIATYAAEVFQGAGGMKFSSPLKALTQPAVSGILDLVQRNATLGVIVSLVLMFTSLKFLVDLARGLVVQRSGRFLNRYLFGAPMVAMVFGAAITFMVQSSSISTSMVVPLIGAGILTLEAVFPFTLGANVGTTMTAMLAALSTGAIGAVIVAFSHFFFNVTGIALIYPVPFIRKIPIYLARRLADLTSRKRFYAFAYVALVFYLVPLMLIFIWR